MHLQYEVVVPHLTDGPPVGGDDGTFEAAARSEQPTRSAPSDDGEYMSAQRAGVCFLKAALCCLKFLLRRWGMPYGERKHLLFALRYGCWLGGGGGGGGG